MRLTDSEEKELWSERPESITRLAEHHFPLVFTIAKAYGVGREDDMISAGCLGLMKAVKTFNPNMGIKFSTYASTCIYTEFRREWQIRKRRKMKGFVDFQEANLPDPGPRTRLDWDELITCFHPEDHELLKLRYRDGLTYGEIGQKFGVSKQWIHTRMRFAFKRRLRDP